MGGFSESRLKNVCGSRLAGTLRREGSRAILTLRNAGKGPLYAGARTDGGWKRFGMVQEGENVLETGGTVCRGLLIGDDCGPVACWSEDGNVTSLYGEYDRLKEAAHAEAQTISAKAPAPAEVVASAEPVCEEAGGQKTFDLREMGVTDVLMWEDTTVGDAADPEPEGENYYEREEVRQRNMREYFGEIEHLLATEAREDPLESLFPGSKFVRIEFDGKGKYYVLGAVYEEGELRYLCYGVPVKKSGVPARFAGIAQIVETGGKGYLILYQDARTGRMLTAEDFA